MLKAIFYIFSILITFYDLISYRTLQSNYKTNQTKL